MRPSIWVALALLFACGDENKAETTALEVRFAIASPTGTTPCSDNDGIRNVSVSVLSSDGLSTLPGYPADASCEAGLFVAKNLPAARYTLVVVARGPVVGEEDAIMFRARRELTFPAESSVELALAPEVAFFDLSWSFGDAPNPCGTEVDALEIFVSGGTAASAFSARPDCSTNNLRLPKPFSPRTYGVQIVASYHGSPIYRATQEIALAAGENEYQLVLTPAGGKLVFDWRFEVSGAFEHTCDASRVSASKITATVRSMQGDDPLVEELGCTLTRPYAFRSARFSEGYVMELELLAEGLHRFRAVSPIVMPEGDLDLGLVTLQAVGNATVSIAISATTSCSLADLDAFQLAVVEDATGLARVEKDLSVSRTTVPLCHLPYGSYEVQISGLRAGAEVCRGGASTNISGRENEWQPISLERLE